MDIAHADGDPISQPARQQWASDHTAIWTGSEMIIWGGFDDRGYVSNGGRFAPE